MFGNVDSSLNKARIGLDVQYACGVTTGIEHVRHISDVIQQRCTDIQKSPAVPDRGAFTAPDL